MTPDPKHPVSDEAVRAAYHAYHTVATPTEPQMKLALEAARPHEEARILDEVRERLGVEGELPVALAIAEIRYGTKGQREYQGVLGEVERVRCQTEAVRLISTLLDSITPSKEKD